MAEVVVKLYHHEDTVVIQYPSWWTVKVIEKRVSDNADPIDGMFNSVGVRVTDSPPPGDERGTTV